MATNTESVDELCDAEIHQKLVQLGSPAGPVTRSTRKFLTNKLKTLMRQQEHAGENKRRCGVYYSSGDESHGEDSLVIPPTTTLRRLKCKVSKSDDAFVSLNTATSSCNSPEPITRKRKSGSRTITSSPITTIDDFGTDSESDLDVVSCTGYESPQASTTTHENIVFHRSSPSIRSKSFREVRNKIKTVVCSNSIPNSKSLLIKEDNKFQDCEEHEQCGYHKDIFHESNITGLQNTSHGHHRELNEESLMYNTQRVRKSSKEANAYFYLKFLAIVSFVVSVCIVYLGFQHNPMYIAAFDSDKNIFPVCGQSNIDPSVCVEEKYLMSAIDIAQILVPLVINLTVEAYCDKFFEEGSVRIPTVYDDEALNHLKAQMPNEKLLNLEKDLKHFKILVLYNPHWEIEIATNGMKDINRILFYGHLTARQFTLPIDCQLRRVIFYIPNFVLFTTVPFSVGYFLLLITRYCKRQRYLHKRNVYRLVNEILYVISSQCNEKNTGNYLPIDQCRNLLIHPDELREKTAEWNDAVEFIENHESRVRTELRGSNGDYVKVWVWAAADDPLNISLHKPGM